MDTPRFTAMLAMRAFVRQLSADQAHLFRQIAVGYQGHALRFHKIVLREFLEEAAAPHPSVPAQELELRAAVSYALGRETGSVPLTVGILQSDWPDLSQPTRDHIAAAIESAFADRRAGGPSEIALWKQILALHASVRDPSLDELRGTAAQAAYESYDFGDAPVADHAGWERAAQGDFWTRLVFLSPVEPGGPTQTAQFSVVFETDSALIKESYGTLNGEIIQAAPSALNP